MYRSPYQRPKFINLVIALESVVLLAFLFLLTPVGKTLEVSRTGTTLQESGENGSSGKAAYIKWVDFDVTKEAMQQAFRYDVDTCQGEIHLNWIELLAYLGARYGGDFSKYKQADIFYIFHLIPNTEALLSSHRRPEAKHSLKNPALSDLSQASQFLYLFSHICVLVHFSFCLQQQAAH